MSCVYLFKGHQFNSELELDDFLLTKNLLRKLLGDAVFQMTGALAAFVGKVLSAHELALLLESELKEAIKRRKLGEDRDNYDFRPPYIGVNKFLSGMKTEDDTLLFPEFIANNYWGSNSALGARNTYGRFGDWAKGHYKEDELELFKKALDFTDVLNAADPDLNSLKITDPATLNKMRELIENKWEHQALVGDAMHSVLELYFSRAKNPDGTDMVDAKGNYIYNKDLLASTPSFLDEFKNQLSQLKYDRKNDTTISFNDLMNGSQIDDAIAKCKKIGDRIKAEFGETAMFFPEFKLIGKSYVPGSNGSDTLFGIIDLLVVDEFGVPHVIDYKTSIHNINDFVGSKKLAYTYLIMTYGKMLGQTGVNVTSSKYYICPIQITDFLRVDDDNYSFGGFNLLDSIFEDMRSLITDERDERLSQLIDYNFEPLFTADEMIQNVHSQMDIWFNTPTYLALHVFTIEKAKLLAEDSKALELKENGKYEFIPSWSKTGKPEITIDPSKTSHPEEDMLQGILKWMQRNVRRRDTMLASTKDGLKNAINAGSVDGVVFTGKDGDSWFGKLVKKYANSSWEICEGDQYKPLEALGIITLFNKEARQFDFIKLSTNNLKRQFNFGSDLRTTLAGCHRTDLYFKANPDSMMMEGTWGNIDLMETLLAINQCYQMFGDNSACMGEVLVADPQLGGGILAASNYELIHTFNELEDAAEDKSTKIAFGNNFKNGKIPVADKLQIAHTRLHDAMEIGQQAAAEGAYNRYDKFNDARNMMDKAIISTSTIDERIEALEEVLKQLRATDKELKNYTVNLEILSKEHVRLYNECLLAIAELKGINFRQLLRDHSKWCESLYIHKNGFSGNMFDNPGNLSSDTINNITKLVTLAYQNVRQDMDKPAAKMRELVEALKKKRNFGWLKEHTFGNQTSLYENMLEERDGDVYFKNPWDPNASLIKEERDILLYILPRINEHRFGKDAEKTKNTEPKKYFRIPLCEGGSASISSKEGLLQALKDKLKSWNPKTAWENAKAKAEGFFDDKMQRTYDLENKHNEDLFEMTNSFDYGEGTLRDKMLARKRYETNLETLFLKHEFAYTMKDRIDAVFPLIKASMISLTTQGFTQNEENGFLDDLKYMDDYIHNKIRNESIIPEQFRAINELANKIKGAASKLVLGFSPVQFIYQTIQGIWNDISLIIRKPDGTNAFTLKNMLSAAKIVYSELVNPKAYSDKPTLIEQFNRLYGVNDMDMNTYIDKIKTDQNGFFNFTNFMFKFASRPDYYNRMTIFVAKMINEGSLEAHKLRKDGTLEYDCAKDKRYRAFFAEDHSNPEEYSKAKALYIAAAKQFEKEGATNEDGTPFKLDLNAKSKLPRAYTNLEAESMKSLSDTIYGYYSHEKKSMIQATLWGSLYMQFKTFWSGKKNQYLAKGGVKLEGKWVPYTEKDDAGNEIHYYYQKDENGNILFNEPPVKEGDPNASSEMVVRWEGNWKEGILSTICTLTGNMWHDKSISKGWHEMWYAEDPNLRNAYRSNIILLGYDSIMWLLVGNLLAAWLTSEYEDATKNASKADYGDALMLSAMNIGIKSLKNSFLDFNFMKSIGDPAISWTPFAFEYMSKLVSNYWDVAMGDQNVWTALQKTTAVGSLFKPVFTTIKFNTKDQ